MNSKKRFIISLLIFLHLMVLFIFTGAIEYNRTYQNNVKQAQDELLLIKLNLENLISSRMLSINGLKAHVETNPDFTQNDYNYFAKGIYESSNDVVQSMAFLTDTVITHIYPYEEYKSIVGTDLSLNVEQEDWITSAKVNEKAIITAPVKLLEGGVGIIVRIPILRLEKYFGQVSIVFDYDKTLASSGLFGFGEKYYVKLSKTDEFTKKEKVIWTNYEGAKLSDNEKVTNEVNLYDSPMSLVAIPKDGFTGKSVLFYLILTIGWVVAIISTIVVYRLLTITIALSVSETQLKETNEGLETVVTKLKTNEEELLNQYDEINKQKKHIEFLADCDYLTGLYNRRRFVEDITLFIENNRVGTIMLFDLDNFKNINDTQGHNYGDKVLQHIGIVLKDAIYKEAVIYRIGGDEFVVHLPDIVNDEEIESFIKSFFGSLKDNSFVEQIKNHITASIGIAKYPSDSSNVVDLLMKSDISMYQAKKEGKNRYCYFNETMSSTLDHNVMVEKELQTALDQHQFKLVYQPIINSVTGKIETLEALLRIKDSLLSPAEFIPVAENSGLIISIGHWVIDEVCFQLNEWKMNFKSVKPVAINVSAKQLYDDSIIEYIENALSKYTLSPELLEIEITESVLIENSALTIKILSKLRNLGIKISLDDFGTGYSSLSYLSYMTVDKVKIDKSLKDKFLFMENGVVMKGLIAICHGMDFKVVTEGVETKEEYERLDMYGVDFLQGYYFERPSSPEHISKILNETYLFNTLEIKNN